MRSAKILLTTLLMLLLPMSRESHAQGLLINELMQSNIDCMMDDQNEFPDSWVELYNPTDEVIYLNDYMLGVSDVAHEAFTLPKKAVAPKQCIIVYCDKDGKDMHTNFRLESGKGGCIYLFNIKGETIDQVTNLQKQPAPNIAYGREHDGSDVWGYQLTPTPGKSNEGGICDHNRILGNPVFSEQGRVAVKTLNLKLSLSLPEGSPEETEIRYTMDGSEPTSKSALYKTPISITSTRVVRARLFCKGWLSPMSTVQSYICFDRDLTLPVISISTNKSYLDDSTLGIFANNNDKKRVNWRRPANIEIFYGEDTNSTINQLCETRVSGGASRGASKKSMAFYANKRFGTKRFDHEFFPDQKPGLHDFKSFVLRNAGNDFDYLYMRDIIAQRTMATHADLDWQAWLPVVVYINGNYYAMLNLRERGNEENVYTNYEGLEDIDLFENWSELKEGTYDNLNAFKDFYKEEGHTFEEFDERMDCNEFCNLMVMNLYYNNLDFPGNNIIMWRPRAEGGRWRWIAKDVDFIMALYGTSYDYKILKWLHNPDYDYSHRWGANSESATLLFRQLMKTETFRDMFIDRCAIFMGDFLNHDGTCSVWDPMYEMISYEYPYHRKLINQWWPNYSNEMKSARDWLSKRTDEFYKQLGDFYLLGNASKMSVNTSGQPLERLSFNGINLSQQRFDGRFYAQRNITLDGEAPEGQYVSGWQVRQVNGSSVTTEHYDGQLLSLVMPNCTSLVVEPILASNTGINDILTDDTHDSYRGAAGVYDLSGRKVGDSLDNLPRGIYIIRGKKVVK